MSVLRELAAVVVESLEADPHRVVLGEDVADGGMLGLSRVAAEREDLRPRLISTPLAPATLPGYAAGLALAGYRPLVVLSSASALIEGLASLREAARFGWRTGDAVRAEVTYLAPYGPGFGLGADAVEAVDALLATVPGVRVVCLGSADEGPAMVRAALEADADAMTTVILLPRTLLLRDLAAGEARAGLGRPVGAARVVRSGSQGTVFAWGPTVELASAAVSQTGFDVQVVDVGGIVPLDRDTILEAAATGKLVIAHAGPMSNGVGAELAALLAEHAILHLDAPVTRVAGKGAPLGAADELQALPSVESIAFAVEQVINY